MSLENLPEMCSVHGSRLAEILASQESARRRNLLIGGLLEETNYCRDCATFRRAGDAWSKGEAIHYTNLQTAKWFLGEYLKHERAFTYFCFEHLGKVSALALELRAS